MESKIENIEKQHDIIIEYSIEQETERVKKTLSKIDWFEKQGYHWKNFNFPKGIDATEFYDKKVIYSDDEISKYIKDEYNEESYKKISELLKNEWEKVAEIFNTKLNQCSLPQVDKYKVVFSSYGTGGSYNLPNIIYLNIKQRNNSENQLFGVMIHEMIHLAIQVLIDQYKLTQWQKERIVDLTLDNFFSGMKNMQKTNIGPKQLEQIDTIYKTNFPSIEETIKQIGELNNKF